MCHACLIVSSAVIQRCSAPDMNTKYRVSYGIETMVWLKQHARTKPSRGSIDCSTRSIAPRHKTSTRLHLFKRILTILYSMTLTNLKVFAWCAICACPLVLCRQALVPARIKELVSGIFRNRLSILRNVQGSPIMMMTLSLQHCAHTHICRRGNGYAPRVGKGARHFIDSRPTSRGLY